MNRIEIVSQALASVFGARETPRGMQVVTHCMYPTNTLVQLTLDGHGDDYVVTDRGAAVDQIVASGAEVHNPDRLLRGVVARFGVHAHHGELYMRARGPAAIAHAVCTVANASVVASEHLFAHLKIRPAGSFKALVSEILVRSNVGEVVQSEIPGNSNKLHHFDNVVRLDARRRVIIDPVLHDPSSMNARVVANMDVKAAQHPDVLQRIVYDDRERWKPEEIGLLAMGAVAVPLSRLNESLARLQAA